MIVNINGNYTESMKYKIEENFKKKIASGLNELKCERNSKNYYKTSSVSLTQKKF